MKTKKSWFLAIAILPLAFIALAVNQTDILPILKTPDFSQLTALPVVRVIDGDTIVVRDIDKEIKVRLIGIDTPETVHPSKPVEHYGKEASRFTDNLLKGEKAYLVSDAEGDKVDKYGRTLPHVYRYPDGLFVNAEIIRQGYGHAYTRFPFKYMEEFRHIERFAREAEKGLWGPTVVPAIDRATAESLLDDGHGWSNRDRTNYYDRLSTKQLLHRLSMLRYRG